MPKKVVLYTRLENNTGGDKAQLDWLIKDLLKKVPPSTLECHLFIQHDANSIGLADQVRTEWIRRLQDNNFGGGVILSQVNSGVAHLRQPNDHLLTENRRHSVASWQNLQIITATMQKDDWFIFAGWSHQMNNLTVAAMRTSREEGGLGLSNETNLLLCSSLGKEIKQEFKTALETVGYTNLYCFEPGLVKRCGFPLGNGVSKAAMQTAEARNVWSQFIGDEPHFQLIGDLREKDQLVVVYHSKDHPNEAAISFLHTRDLSSYSVILIGDQEAADSWRTALSNMPPAYQPLPNQIHNKRRTDANALRRGFNDAEIAITTAPTTYLECLSCGINIQFFAAPHLNALQIELDAASVDSIKWSFMRGSRVHEELPNALVNNDFQPRFLTSDTAPLSSDQQRGLAEHEEHIVQAEMERLPELAEEHLPQLAERVRVQQNFKEKLSVGRESTEIIDYKDDDEDDDLGATV